MKVIKRNTYKDFILLIQAEQLFIWVGMKLRGFTEKEEVIKKT